MPTKQTKYYYAHREQCQENSRLYAAANREKIKERAAEYYQKVLKQRRRIDRMYAKADLPLPPRKEPKPILPPRPRKEPAIKAPKPVSNIKTTKRFLTTEPVAKNPRKPRVLKTPDLSMLTDIPIMAPSNGVSIIKTEVMIDWNNL
jgi:hypothetical protein